MAVGGRLSNSIRFYSISYLIFRCCESDDDNVVLNIVILRIDVMTGEDCVFDKGALQ